MYREYLAWRGLDVREVDSAASAVRELSRSLPDVVVTEDRLPDSTGPELVRTLRRTRYTFDLPIVLLCSDTFAIQIDQPERYACDRIVVVPLLPAALFDVLQEVTDERSGHGPERFESWLFTRNGDSVWIVRTTELELSVAGPGRGRNVFAFVKERDLLSFQAEYERRLMLDRFTARAEGEDRRTGRDRRERSRPGAHDRRAVP
jgi:CheY-like chemotaxis protein